MKQLIENNAAIINATNHANQVPLHLAAKNGHKEVFNILKTLDADDLSDNDEKTSEDYARDYEHYDNAWDQPWSHRTRLHQETTARENTNNGNNFYDLAWHFRNCK